MTAIRGGVVMIRTKQVAVLGVLAMLGAAGAGLADAPGAVAPAGPSPMGGPGGPPRGPPPPPARGPSLDVALEAVQAAIAACAADNLKVTAVAADSSGAIKAAMVSDGVNGMTAAFAQRKIAVVIDFKKPSSQVMADARNDKELAARLAANPNYFAVPGAVPLTVGEELIGALAVSGASGEQDEACALAAVAKVKTG
jgi:uncharacterized protein GlcG (DUF336 family)